MERMIGETLNITDENIKVIAEYFPEVMEEGKIKFDVLKELLGEFVDDANERYQFTWNGKSQALKLSQTPSTGTLLPCKEKSKDWDTTENLYIEGDNLEVLKLLQKSYYKRIKMIYIDPPYNTGSDFVYKDDFKDNIKNYKEVTKQESKANPETQGRFHTDWLNMMYSRLRLAKNVLSDQGVILISMDDNEYGNLKKICDEIFGEINFVGTICWQRKTQPSFLSSKISSIKEYILVYTKDFFDLKTMGGFTDAEKQIEMINISNSAGERIFKKENVLIANGNYTGVLNKGTYGNGELIIELLEDVEVNEGRCLSDIKLKGRFKWTQENINNTIGSNDIVHIKNIKTLRPTVQIANKEVGIKPILDLLSKKLNDEIPTNTDATNEIKNMFEGYAVMDFPKPSKLIKYLIRAITYNDKDAIIMDFFSGSSTTADAVMQQNVEDDGKRKFIMVQLPEICDENTTAYKRGYKNICEIGQERIRRAGKQIKEETNANIDYGFKVFKLDSSNLKLWNGEFNTEEEANNYFLEHLSPLVDGRTNEDLLYELLLKEGMPLTSPIEEIKVGDKTFYSIGMGYLTICLEDKIDMDLVEEIGKRKPESVIFRDSGFADENAKINTIQELKKYGIAEEVIKSI